MAEDSTAPSLPPGPEARAGEDENRLRVCSVSGMLGALAIVVAFFLPWVLVKPDAAAAYRQRVIERLDDERRSPPPRAEDWRRLAEQVARDRQAAGIDIFWWARIAGVDEQGNPPRRGDTSTEARMLRAIRVGAVWLGAMPVLATLLFAYFLTHHCRRARTPALIAAMLVGATAVVTTATYNRISEALGQELQPGRGLPLLLAGGAVLFLAGSFGVKARNWWKVFGGTIVIAGIITLGIVAYVPIDLLGPDGTATPVEGEPVPTNASEPED